MSDDIPLDDLAASLADGWDDQAPRQSPGMLGIRVINWRTLEDRSPRRYGPTCGTG